MSNLTRTVQRVKAKIKAKQIEKGRKRIHNLGTGLARVGWIEATAYERGYNDGYEQADLDNESKESTNETP